MVHSNELTLIQIPWEDVLFKKVFPKLSLKDLFILRQTAQSYKILVESYLSELRQVNLARYQKFNPNAFKVLISHCGNVRSANFTRCTWLVEEDLLLFFKNNPCISEISFNNCSDIVNRLLHLSVIRCKNLKKISLAGCRKLTIGAFETLIFHQHNIHSLDISRCVLLTERCIIKFVIKFPSIKNLSLVGIPSVTDRVILYMKQHCLQLENLNVDGCSVSTPSISKLLMSGPKIQSIRAYGKFITSEQLGLLN